MEYLDDRSLRYWIKFQLDRKNSHGIHSEPVTQRAIRRLRTEKVDVSVVPKISVRVEFVCDNVWEQSPGHSNAQKDFCQSYLLCFIFCLYVRYRFHRFSLLCSVRMRVSWLFAYWCKAQSLLQRFVLYKEFNCYLYCVSSSSAHHRQWSALCTTTRANTHSVAYIHTWHQEDRFFFGGGAFAITYS